MFEVGDEFLYYGNNELRHGEVGIVMGVLLNQEYMCKVPWTENTLYLYENNMCKPHFNKTPDWEV